MLMGGRQFSRERGVGTRLHLMHCSVELRHERPHVLQQPRHRHFYAAVTAVSTAVIADTASAVPAASTFSYGCSARTDVRPASQTFHNCRAASDWLLSPRQCALDVLARN